MTTSIDINKNEDFTPDRPMSPSSAKAILEDAELWKWKKENPPPPSKASAFGSALHCLLLEPDKFDKQFVVRKDVPINKSRGNPYGRTSNKFKDWFETIEHEIEGKVLLMPSEHKELMMVQKQYQKTLDGIVSIEKLKNPDAVIERERPVEWIDPVSKQPCKGIIDIMCGQTIVDLKTTGDISDSALTKKINYEYHIQAAAYAEALRRLDSVEDPRVYFMFVLSKPPYIIRVQQVNSDVLEYGLEEFRRAIRVYKEWAKGGFKSLYRGIEVVGLKPYRIYEIQAENGRG